MGETVKEYTYRNEMETESEKGNWNGLEIAKEMETEMETIKKFKPIAFDEIQLSVKQVGSIERENGDVA